MRLRHGNGFRRLSHFGDGRLFDALCFHSCLLRCRWGGDFFPRLGWRGLLGHELSGWLLGFAGNLGWSGIGGFRERGYRFVGGGWSAGFTGSAWWLSRRFGGGCRWGADG